MYPSDTLDGVRRLLHLGEVHGPVAIRWSLSERVTVTVRGDVPFVPLPGHTRARSDREPPGTGRRRDGKPAWYLPTALIVDAAGAAAPVYMTLCLAGEAHAVRYAAVMAGVWVLVRASRTRYAWRNLGERGNAAPLLRDWLILVALLAVVRAATGEGPPFIWSWPACSHASRSP